MTKRCFPARTVPGVKVRVFDPRVAPSTSAPPISDAARTAVRCCRSKPGRSRFARMFSMRNGFPVASDRLSDERKICPPPSPEDPSIRIMVPLHLRSVIPLHIQLGATCERSLPGRLAPPSRPQSTCTRPEFHRSRQRPSGTLHRRSCVRDLLGKIAALLRHETSLDLPRDYSFGSFPDYPCRER